MSLLPSQLKTVSGWAALVFAFHAAPGLARPQHPLLKQKEAGLKWSELGPVIIEHRISIVLADGARIKGEALAVRPDALVIDIHKTSDKKNYPKGQVVVPRSLVPAVRVIRDRGPLKLVGGIIGTVGGFAIVAAIAVATDSAGVFWLDLLIPPLTGTLGYYGGKAADQRSTLIRIVE